MYISVFDIFRAGLGPSSSHTVGPMKAGQDFVNRLRDSGIFDQVASVRIRLLGSLAATGVGHATDQAVLLGLMGKSPSTVDIDMIPKWISEIKNDRRLLLSGCQPIHFDCSKDMTFEPSVEDPYHTNAMEIFALDRSGRELFKKKYFSVGGGFIETEEEAKKKASKGSATADSKEGTPLPYPYTTARELIAQCSEHNLSVAELVRANERATRSDEIINESLDFIWSVMANCTDRGLRADGVLPGSLGVKRRAKKLYERLLKNEDCQSDPLQIIDWINAFAFAVSEENAAGGKVVTAPTNGAAGVIPAVIRYYRQFVKGANLEGVRTFLLVAGAIGALYKRNASISGAEVGCQGEVGVACSMAAAGLAAALGATNTQIENAAEIGMEHHLGLTCDPINGQVQIPCIERNAIAAVKAVNAVRLAMNGDGSHYVSLDNVIKTMLQTGKDMRSKYKETSLGGLAVCVVEC